MLLKTDCLSCERGRPTHDVQRTLLVALDEGHRVRQQSRHMMVLRPDWHHALMHWVVALVDVIQNCGHDDPIWFDLMEQIFRRMAVKKNHTHIDWCQTAVLTNHTSV